MQTHRFWRDQFHAYRMWILERGPGAGPAGDGATSLPAGIDLAFLDRHARRDWVCLRGGDGDWPQFRVALLHDHDLVLARRGADILGWGWVGYERVYLPPLGREIRLAEGTAYLYDAYVRPAERGAGIGRALVGARCRRADAAGVGRLVTHVLVGNEPSLRSLRAHGFAVVGRTAFLRALALRVWTREPLPAPRAPLPAPRAA
jgi:ribosomal protein S18 acetylase RimI-like enzyme